MRALVKHAPGEGNISIGDMPEPVCGEGQVKIEVRFCGVCGTDLHVLHDTFPNYPPVILGHEFSGEVVEIGGGVTTVAPGDGVTVFPASAVICGKCPYCRSGNFLFCPTRRGMGHGVNGAFTRYAVVREDQAYKLPDGFSLEEAALSEPFAAATHAVCEITMPQAGDVVLLSGPGPIGLMCLKLLVVMGIHTIVAGLAVDAARLECARQIGAAWVVNVESQDVVEVVRQATGGVGANIAIEAAGSAASLRNCLEAVRPMGRITQAGIFGREIEIPLDSLFHKQLELHGSVGYTPRTWDRVMSIYAQGKLRLCDIISDVLPLSQWDQAFNICASKRGLKVLITPQDKA
jgi:L-iditol 2-dehydrogenase